MRNCGWLKKALAREILPALQDKNRVQISFFLQIFVTISSIAQGG